MFIRKPANYLNFISALLLEAQSTPFQITPSTMANIVKGLYTLRPGKKRMLPQVSRTLVDTKIEMGKLYKKL